MLEKWLCVLCCQHLYLLARIQIEIYCLLQMSDSNFVQLNL